MELHPILESDTVPNPDLWFVVSALGDCPSMRAGHTCVFIKGKNKNGKLYVIGGADPSGPFNDTYVLDLETLSWDFFESPGLRPRYEHAAFVPEDQPTKIYVFGGADQSGNMDDVQVLDTKANKWSSVSVSGAPPSARTHHTSAVVGNKLIIYSGGQCGVDPVSDRKVHSFDAHSCSWSVIDVKGDSPKPRQGHAMTAIGSKIYLHGGMASTTFYEDFHVLDTEKGSWSNIRRKGVSPSPRAAHSLVGVGSTLYLFGGYNQNGAQDDMYKFSTETSCWCKVELQGPPPACRLDFGVCTIELQRSVSAADNTEGSADLVIAGTQAKEVLDRELSKPSSASSHGSRCGSDSSFGAYMVQDRLLPDASQVNSETQQNEEVDGASPGTDGVLPLQTPENRHTYKLCLINGGMDHSGQIFDDTLVFLIK